MQFNSSLVQMKRKKVNYYQIITEINKILSQFKADNTSVDLS